MATVRLFVGRRTAMNILVAYASKHGATAGIAERIARTLERPGLDVTLKPAEEAGAIDGYDAFVVGSAAYMGGWMGEATTFVRRHRELLARQPVWLFSSGPVGCEPLDAKGRDVVKASEPKEFEEFARTIRPRGMRVFFGAYDPEAPPVGVAEGLMARFMRVAPAVRNALPAGDFRDWPTIEAWAETIARDLRPVAAMA
jgi:menaquinone-dependent protoporphyrinogen oxidase